MLVWFSIKNVLHTNIWFCLGARQQAIAIAIGRSDILAKQSYQLKTLLKI